MEGGIGGVGGVAALFSTLDRKLTLPFNLKRQSFLPTGPRIFPRSPSQHRMSSEFARKNDFFLVFPLQVRAQKDSSAQTKIYKIQKLSKSLFPQVSLRYVPDSSFWRTNILNFR